MIGEVIYNMVLTKRTFNILNNFSTINNGILVEGGNKIRTISEGLNILAYAEIADVFPQSFAVYDLKKFLSAISLYENPVLEFEKKFVKITGTGTNDSIIFYYASPSMITSPEKDKTMDDIEGQVSFKIDDVTLNRINKTTGVLGVPYISFISDGTDFRMVSCDKSNPTSDKVEFTNFNVTKNEKELKLFAKFENMKLLPGNYEVSVSERGIAFFHNVDLSVKYWIALEINS